MKTTKRIVSMILMLGLFYVALAGCAEKEKTERKNEQKTPADAKSEDLKPADMENLVRRSYQYVALFNTINNFAVNDKNPFAADGWNKTHYPEGLMDASVRAIPRPNNDTLYVISLLDLRKDAVVIEYPVFKSKFVSLETSAMDHYCEIPLATSNGDSNQVLLNVVNRY